MMRCPKCKGKGRVRRDPITADEVVFTFGMAAVIRGLVECDKDDDRFWKDCRTCRGEGYVG